MVSVKEREIERRGVGEHYTKHIGVFKSPSAFDQLFGGLEDPIDAGHPFGVIGCLQFDHLLDCRLPKARLCCLAVHVRFVSMKVM